MAKGRFKTLYDVKDLTPAEKDYLLGLLYVATADSKLDAPARVAYFHAEPYVLDLVRRLMARAQIELEPLGRDVGNEPEYRSILQKILRVEQPKKFPRY